MIRILKNNKIVISLIILFIIFNSGYAMSTITDIGVYANLILGFVFVFPILAYYKKNKLDKMIIALLLLYMMLIFSYIFSGFKATQTYIFYISSITIGFGVSIIYDIEHVKEIFLKTMTYVSIISLVGYILINYTELLGFLPSLSNINGVVYNVGYVFFSIPVVPDRNCGIFWEPGLFSTFLVLAILIETLFKNRRTNWLKVAIFIICIATTKSAAGYGLLVFVIMAIIFDRMKSNKIIGYFFGASLIIAWVFVMLNYSYIINNTSLKNNEVISRFTSEDESANMRMYAVKHNLERFIDSPIFGRGIKEIIETSTLYEDTSTSTYMLAQFGILGSLYTIYWIIGIMGIKKKNILTILSVLAIAILILNKEPHQSILFTWCLMFYLLKNKFKGEEILELND